MVRGGGGVVNHDDKGQKRATTLKPSTLARALGTPECLKAGSELRARVGRR